MSCVPAVRALAMLALLFTAAPALGQQTSEQFIHQGLRATGLTDYDIASGSEISSRTKTVDKGLVVDIGWVQPRQADPNSNNAGTMVVMILNPTSQPWCVRPKGAVRGNTVQSSEVTTHNFVVEPGTSARFAHAVIAPNGNNFNYETAYVVAVWAPDFSQPFESQCKAAAPEYLDAWLASPSYRPYVDFAENAEAEQEWNEMIEYSENENSED